MIDDDFKDVNKRTYGFVVGLIILLIILVIGMFFIKDYFKKDNSKTDNFELNSCYADKLDNILNFYCFRDASEELVNTYPCENCSYDKIINDEFIIIKKDNKILYNIKTNKEVITYDEITNVDNTHFIVSKDNMFGIYNIKGSLDINLEYQMITKESYGYKLFLNNKYFIYDDNYEELFSYETIENTLNIIKNNEIIKTENNVNISSIKVIYDGSQFKFNYIINETENIEFLLEDI